MFPVGIDVSKNTLDLYMLYDGIKGRIKTRNIQNNRHLVEGTLRGESGSGLNVVGIAALQGGEDVKSMDYLRFASTESGFGLLLTSIRHHENLCPNG